MGIWGVTTAWAWAKTHARTQRVMNVISDGTGKVGPFFRTKWAKRPRCEFFQFDLSNEENTQHAPVLPTPTIPPVHANGPHGPTTKSKHRM